MLPLADVHELEARLGRVFTGEETARAAALLDDASALVRDEAGLTWVGDDGLLTVVPAAVRAVVLKAAERAARNPDGFRSESAGDYSYQRGDAEPGVFLTDAERRIVRRSVGRGGLWTQPTTRGDDEFTTVWVDDQFGAEPIPYDVYRN
ncbi:MAG TPA: Gp19/Gp15/Gp42 family protein [Pseudonocardia sp.]|nr:Gp19/Gp15/Gp42 family protein [Pseudonocardia sp.]